MHPQFLKTFVGEKVTIHPNRVGDTILSKGPGRTVSSEYPGICTIPFVVRADMQAAPHWPHCAPIASLAALLCHWLGVTAEKAVGKIVKRIRLCCLTLLPPFELHINWLTRPHRSM